MSRSDSAAVLFGIIVDSITFLALSDDDTVDQDAAVEQLEHIAAQLDQLPGRNIDQFLTFVERGAREAREAGEHARAAFLASLPAQLGLRRRGVF